MRPVFYHKNRTARCVCQVLFACVYCLAQDGDLSGFDPLYDVRCRCCDIHDNVAMPAPLIVHTMSDSDTIPNPYRSPLTPSS